MTADRASDICAHLRFLFRRFSEGAPVSGSAFPFSPSFFPSFPSSTWECSRNANGVPSHSPGLRAARYPGSRVQKCGPTLKGLNPARFTPGDETLSGFARIFGHAPRVARSAQPWAERWNAVGVRSAVPALRVAGWALTRSRPRVHNRPMPLRFSPSFPSSTWERTFPRSCASPPRSVPPAK